MSDRSQSSELFQVGLSGIKILEDAIRPLMLEHDSPLPENRTRAGFVINSYALVWFGISHYVHVDKGKSLMDEQIELLTKELPEMGFSWSREQTEAGIGQTWTSMVQLRGSGGDQLFQMGKLILSYFVDEENIGVVEVMAVVTCISSILEGVKEETQRVQ